MKKDAFSALSQSRPLLFAASGYLAGILLFALLGYEAFGHAAPPLSSAFSYENKLMALIADFAHEASLFATAAGLSLLVKHPLPSLAVLFLRGSYFGLSAAYLYGTSCPLPLYLSYVALNTAILVSYAAIASALVFYTAKEHPNRSEALYNLGYAFFYFTGVILLLVVIRNLAYWLLLPR